MFEFRVRQRPHTSNNAPQKNKSAKEAPNDLTSLRTPPTQVLGWFASPAVTDLPQLAQDIPESIVGNTNLVPIDQRHPIISTMLSVGR